MSELIDNHSKIIVKEHLDRLSGFDHNNTEHKLSTSERQQKFEEIALELKKRNAVLVAHYYCDPDIQALAEATLRDQGWN